MNGLHGLDPRARGRRAHGERRGTTLRAVAVAALGVALLQPAASARAAAPALAPRLDLVRDGVATGTTAVATLTLLALEQRLAPTRCRWCDPPPLDARLSSALRWRDAGAAVRSSDALAIALAGGALGYGLLDAHRRGAPEVGWENALLVTEATSVAMLVDTGVKYAAGRQRPDAWRGRPGAREERDRNLSFFSAHTTFAFALASSSSTLLLSQDAPHARTYAVLAFGAAATVAYLRVAAEKHYPSDVLVGAGVGTLVGWAIPHFLHAPRPGGVQLVPAPGGLAVVW